MKLQHQTYKLQDVQGRYLPPARIASVLAKWHGFFGTEVRGHSVQGRDIVGLRIGKGDCKILMWSQMHGNESTTTKALLDLIEFLTSSHEQANLILASCTIWVLPVLNPDGAHAYTRTNANDVDLNRDAVDLSQPESIVLRKMFEEVQPDFCFNLHDQRTIFNVGSVRKPATLSFLSPAADKKRSITPARAESMKLIAAMNQSLQQLIPGQVGRYDDSFNINCVGDTFQSLGTPTILFEAGHYEADYQRERTREYVWWALLHAIRLICENKVSDQPLSEYLEIPENSKMYYDILLRNAHLLNGKWDRGVSAGILFKEKLVGEAIQFVPYVADIADLGHKFGHIEIDCSTPEGQEWLNKNTDISGLF